ncbi:hypothetical protein [Maritalea myrionectae]|uniref:hypothetical protein n=1 Tax=Maritalea myrionectae TaxID=454601 RepID=UPI000420CC3C|nr:hypothetical protein [Maritalea myrionectae]
MDSPFFETYEPANDPVMDDAAANYVERGNPEKGVADCDVQHIGISILRQTPPNEVAIYQALKDAGLTLEQIQRRLPGMLRAMGGTYAELADNLRQKDLH